MKKGCWCRATAAAGLEMELLGQEVGKARGSRTLCVAGTFAVGLDCTWRSGLQASLSVQDQDRCHKHVSAVHLRCWRSLVIIHVAFLRERKFHNVDSEHTVSYLYFE